MSQKSKEEKVKDKLKNLMIILEILSIDKKSILMALNSDFKDFEVAIQNYAAEMNEEINLIVTRNTVDFKKSKLSIMSPEEFLKSTSTF